MLHSIGFILMFVCVCVCAMCWLYVHPLWLYYRRCLYDWGTAGRIIGAPIVKRHGIITQGSTAGKVFLVVSINHHQTSVYVIFHTVFHMMRISLICQDRLSKTSRLDGCVGDFPCGHFLNGFGGELSFVFLFHSAFVQELIF